MKARNRISIKILISFMIIVIIMFIATSKINIFTRATNFILGDVNGDQVIDEKDMFLMIRNVSPRASSMGWTLEGEQFQAGDVTKDNAIDEDDILIILRYISAEKSEQVAEKYPEWLELLKEIPATGITLNKTSLELNKGSSETLTKTLTPSDSTDSVTWSSSNTNIATVSYGTVTAVAKGTATITARTTSGKEATCEVTVKVPATGITLNKTSLELNKGSSETLTKTLTPSDSTDSVTWNSSNTNIAAVNNGTVTAVAKGTATITATTTSGKKATCEVTVKVPATGITLNKTSLELNKGSSETLTKTLTPSDSTDSVTWNSSNTNIATVSNGTVTAVAKGTATITATTTSGKEATCEVTVKVPATGITLNETSLSLTDETTATLTATLTPSDSTDGITWSSNSTSIATVSGTGKTGTVTINKKGIVTITATTTSGKKATCEITISGWWYNQVNEKWYYYEDGIKQTGWKVIDGNIYYFNDYAVGSWQTINNKVYYFNPTTGILHKGWLVWSGDIYYLSESDGERQTGWKEINDKWYYFDPSSGIMQTGWKDIDEDRYYFNANGNPVGSWQEIDDYWYYFDTTTGKMQKGWLTWSDNIYYLSESDGIMQTGWVEISNKWYYFNPANGTMQTGWLVWNNNTYYLKETGEAVYNCAYTINGESYNFNTNGELTTVSVLFIGNSKSYYNKLYRVFGELATTDGKDVHSEYLPEIDGYSLKNLYGGRWLKQLIRTDTYPQIPEIVKSTISKRRWDYIVLQENGYIYLDDYVDSITGVKALTTLKEGVQEIVEYTKENSNESVKLVLDAVWIWESLDPNLEYASTKNIINAREYIKGELGLEGQIVYTGRAFMKFKEDCGTNYNSSLLFVNDKLHPTPLGTYLRACCDYATIFGKSPQGINYYKSYDNSGAQINLTETAAKEAQTAAEYAYENSQTIRSTAIAEAPKSVTQQLINNGATLDIIIVDKNNNTTHIYRDL